MVKHSKNKNCSEQLRAVISMRVVILCPVKMTRLLCLFCLTSSDFMEDILWFVLHGGQTPIKSGPDGLVRWYAVIILLASLGACSDKVRTRNG